MKHKDDKELEFENEGLPKGWVRTKIQNTSELIGGGTPSRKNSEYFNGEINWLTPTEIPKYSITKISNSREKITELGLQKSSARLIPAEAVLFTSRASIGYVAIAGDTVTTNQGFASFVCNSLMFNYYLAYWLWGNKTILEANATGTTFKEIPKSKLKELIIPLPPLNEQKRIVTKIESIFSQIDAAKEKLERLALQMSSASGSLAQLKSSVLKQAFEGRLVSQDPNDESAEILLKKIHKDSKNELEFENEGLPKGWVRTKIQNTSELIGGGTPSRKNSEYFNGEINWLTPTEIPKYSITKISNSREKITELGLQKSSARLIPAEAVLFTSRASIGYVAIAGDTVTTNQGFASFVCNSLMFNYYL